MTAADLLGRLDAVKGGGGSWTARCPAHEDRSPSLSVQDGGDRVLLKCHAGCTAEAVVGALGLSLGDLFTEPKAKANGTAPEIVATYPYTDEDGGLLFEAVRFFPKDFRQRRPDGRGGWTWKLGDVRRVLYRLPAVVEAVALGKPVYIVEGEKDAEALERLGAVATTCPMGAGKWRPEHSETLREARVRIVADRDEPGRAHALAVAEALAGIADEVELLEPAQGKDAHDHVEAGLGLDQLVPMKTDASPSKEALPRFVTAAEAKDEPPPSFLVDSLIPDGEPGLLAGDGGAFKTTVGLEIAGAVAAGCAVFDRFPVRRPGAVMIVSEEDSGGVLANRLEALCLGHGWDAGKVLARVHILARAGMSLTAPEWQEHVLEAAREIRPSLMIFDPLAELLEGEENSSSEARPAVRYIRRLTEVTGAAVLIIHHAGKKVEGKRKLDRLRGTTAWPWAARCIWFLEPTAEGVAMECLKLSRAEIPPPFVVTRDIEAGENPAVWARARLTWQGVKEPAERLAEAWVLGQLTDSPGPSTSAIKEAATARNHRGAVPAISGKDVSDAIKALRQRGRITYTEGARGARLWHLLGGDASPTSDLAGQAGQGGEIDVAEVAQPCRATSADGSTTLPPPIGGKVDAGSPGDAGQGGTPGVCDSCGVSIGQTATRCAACRYAGAA